MQITFWEKGNFSCSTRQNLYANIRKFIAKELISKVIGNRKGDCAWSCSRWQTQPEKICKLQRTNQCPLRTLYWFLLCNLQIFSGSVCHLDQLHAQSPFLFPIVLILIWFLLLRLAWYWLCFLRVALLNLGHCPVATVAVCGLATGLWCFTVDCHVKSLPLPSTPLNCKLCLRRWEKV